MSTFRAKLIVERVESNRPRRGVETLKEAVYDELRIEVTALDSSIALSKVIGLALSEQADRDARAVMPGDQNKPGPLTDDDEDDEEDEDDDAVYTSPPPPRRIVAPRLKPF